MNAYIIYFSAGTKDSSRTRFDYRHKTKAHDIHDAAKRLPSECPNMIDIKITNIQLRDDIIARYRMMGFDIPVGMV